MTGFDSKSDRREAIRKQIIDECVFTVNRMIIERSVTQTPAERSLLLLGVTMRLSELSYLDAQMLMLVKEI